MDREKIADSLEQIANELREGDGGEWPYDEIAIPYNSDDMNEDNWEDSMKTKHTPPYEGVKIMMPEGEHDFPCNECGGQYGPWIKKKFWYHDFASLSDSPSINLGISRVRRCENCGDVHFSSHSMGRVSLKVNERSGLVKLDSVIDE